MKYIDPLPDGEGDDGFPILELTRRNLVTLLEKLDDPDSQRMLLDPDGKLFVRAVENEVHYGVENRLPGITYTNGEYK